jgi:hypothetical protein
MDDVDPHGWFKGEELKSCAACGERGAIRLPTNGLFLCLSCGAVSSAEGSPTPSHDDPAIDAAGRSEQDS